MLSKTYSRFSEFVKGYFISEHIFDMTAYLQVCTVVRMHLFPIAVITNYHKLSDLKRHKLIILQFCRSEVQHKSHWAKIKVLVGFFVLSQRLYQRICFLVFPSFQRPLMFLACWSPSIIFKVSKGAWCPPYSHLPLALTSSSTFKDTFNYIQHSQTIRDDLLILILVGEYISQSSPEKQNKQDVYTHMWREIYFEELVHAIVRAHKSKICGKTRRVETQGRVDVEFKAESSLGQNPLFLRAPQPFQSSVAWMRPTYSMESNLLYVKYRIKY